MKKIDFKTRFKPLYNPPKGDFAEIDVPQLMFVKVDGQGDPNTSEEYHRAVEWLYGVSFAMKFASKKELDQDYVVPPLEGLWWADDPEDFMAGQKDNWRWTMMIMVPEFVPREMFEAAVAKVQGKLGDLPESLRLEPCEEGLCLQILHVGSYADEAPVLDRLHHQVMPERQMDFNGPHHEIYLGDPRKTAPDRLKTVLRQPVKVLEGA